MKSKRKVAKGDLLIADPFLGDANFDRTVIYIVEHNLQGTLGFVLNNMMPITLMDVVNVGISDSLDIPLFDGGPVAKDTMQVLHPFGHLVDNSVRVKDNIYWGGDFEQMKMLIHNKNATWKDFKFFVGYAGWDAGQLAYELQQKSWIISSANEDLVFDHDTKGLWSKVMNMLEPKLRVLANSPKQPYFN